MEITSTVVLLAVVVADLSRVFHAVDSATLQAALRHMHGPRGMPAAPAALPTHSFGDVDDLVIQIFAPVCLVATAPPHQTKIALLPGALPKLHGIHCQHHHPLTDAC